MTKQCERCGASQRGVLGYCAKCVADSMSYAEARGMEKAAAYCRSESRRLSGSGRAADAVVAERIANDIAAAAAALRGDEGAGR